MIQDSLRRGDVDATQLPYSTSEPELCIDAKNRHNTPLGYTLWVQSSITAVVFLLLEESITPLDAYMNIEWCKLTFTCADKIVDWKKHDLRLCRYISTYVPILFEIPDT